MKLQHVAVIFVIIIVPLTMVLATYINTEIKTIRYTSKYDAFLIDATYDALKAYQLNSFNNNIRTISNSKIRDIEASMNVYFQTLSSDFKSVGYTQDQMIAYTPAVLFSLYDGYYIYTKNFDVEKSITYNAWEEDSVSRRIADQSTKYQYGLKPFVYYSCRYKKGSNTDFVVNYTLDNRISVIGKVDGVTVTKSGPLLYIDEAQDADIISLLEEGEVLSDYLLILDNNSYIEGTGSEPGEYEYVIYNNEKVYLDFNWANEPDSTEPNYCENIVDIIDKITSGAPQDQWGWPLLNKLFFRYSENYTKRYLSDPVDIANIARKLKKEDDGKGHLCSTSGLQYYEEGKAFTEWVTDNISDITQYDAVDENGEYLVNHEIGPDYVCKFVTDISGNGNDEGFIFNISADNNPLLPNSAFNEHRISVIRHSIETNLSAAMNSYISEANVGYQFTMPIFTENDWNKIENNVCVTSFLQGMPVGSQIYEKYFVLSNNANQDAVDLDSVFVIAKNSDGDIEYHKAGCKHLFDDISNIQILGVYQSSDFKRRSISVSGEDINALSQLNKTEGTNFNYYYFHQIIGKNLLKGACYDCIVNVSTAYGASELIQGKYYDYDQGAYLDIPTDNAEYNHYLNQYKAALYRIRNNAYMINGYFGS